MPPRLSQVSSLVVSVAALFGCAGLGGCRATIAVAPSKREVAKVEIDAGNEPAVTKPTNPTMPAPLWLNSAPPLARSDWCIEALSALDEETCYVLPSEPTHTLLIYLHGVIPPIRDSEQKTNVETV